jgi:hypothetical protein
MSNEYNYNVFQFLRQNETFHSGMIAAIVAHDKKCWNSFFDMLKRNSNDEKIDDLRNSIVHDNSNHQWIDTEVNLKETISDISVVRKRGRADIWIGSNNYHDKDAIRYRLIIENKINAGNQDHQLRRYYRYLTGEGRANSGLFFLCKEKKEEFNLQAQESAVVYSKESNGKEKENTQYEIITYKDDIIPWLKRVIVEAGDTDFIVIVKQYLEIVKSLVGLK